MVGWLGGWVVEWLGRWVTGWLGGWVAGWLGGWLAGWRSKKLAPKFKKHLLRTQSKAGLPLKKPFIWMAFQKAGAEDPEFPPFKDAIKGWFPLEKTLYKVEDPHPTQPPMRVAGVV